MSNNFLPPFPREGLTVDYVNNINEIFALISTHDHVILGNKIQSDSVNWEGIVSVNLLDNINDISFVNVTSPAPGIENYLYVSDEFNNLYYKKQGFAPIQIVDRLFVNAFTTINGISGTFLTYGVNLAYSSTDSSYTFHYSNGLLNVYVNTINSDIVNGKIFGVTNLSIANAPNVTPLNGYAYFNQDSSFIYNDKVIKLDKTVKANALIFDNLVKYDLPPVGFTYPSSPISSINLYKYNSTGALTVSNYFVTDGTWFNGITNDETVNGKIKSSFYCEPVKTLILPFIDNLYELTSAKERWVWSLTNQKAYSQKTRILHYTFNLFNITKGKALPVTGWNDCLIENTSADTNIQKFVLMDIAGTPNIEFNMKFHYLYDMGTIEV